MSASLGHVDALEDRTAAGLLAFGDRVLAAFAIEIGDDHRGALSGEADRGGAADSARRTGYHCNFSIESSHWLALLA